MATKTDDLRIREIKELISPEQLMKDIPVSSNISRSILSFLPTPYSSYPLF